MEDNYTFNVDIETGNSPKSLADLRKEAKELRNQLLNLEEGTEEYSNTLSQLGKTLGDIKDNTELAKAVTQDFGQQMANVTGTLKGISGGVTAITGALSLMGVEMGEDTKVLKTLTSLMAMTQGIAAVESGIKAFKGLTTAIRAATVAQKGLNTAMKANVFIAIASVALTAVGALVSYKNAAKEAAEEQAELNRQMREETLAKWGQDFQDYQADFAKRMAKRRKEMEADGKSRVEIERMVAEETKKEYDKQKAELDRLLKAQKDYEFAIEASKKRIASGAVKGLLAEGEARSIESNKEQLKRLGLAIEEATRRTNDWDEAVKDANLDVRIAERNVRSATRTVTTEVKTVTKELDAATNTERNFFSDIVNGWNLVEVNTKTGAETVIKTVDGLITRLQQAGLNDEANFFSGFMTVDKVDDVKTYLDMNIEQIEEFVQHADILSDEIIEHLRTAKDEGVITMEELSDFWKNFIEGNEHVLQEFKDISSGYEGALADATAPLEVVQAASLDNQKKYNELMIRVLDERISWLNEFGTEEERAEISRYLAQKAALTKQTEIYAEYKAATEEYNQTIQKLRKEYAEKEDSFWEYMVQQSGNLQQELREKELQAEIDYWEELKSCATEGTEQYEAIVEKIAELTQELNDLK